MKREQRVKKNESGVSQFQAITRFHYEYLHNESGQSRGDPLKENFI